MSKRYRRYELLLPRRFNDGRPVPRKLLLDTVLELMRQFNAVSKESQVISGTWENEGRTYRDELVRLFLDVPDTSKSRHFFLRFKEQRKKRFQQIDLWITAYPVEVL